MPAVRRGTPRVREGQFITSLIIKQLSVIFCHILSYFVIVHELSACMYMDICDIVCVNYLSMVIGNQFISGVISL